jgi:hypothetical protein
MTSDDAGRSWAEPHEVTRTTGISDHPLLLADGSNLLVAWHTAAEGYRLLTVDSSRASY